MRHPTDMDRARKFALEWALRDSSGDIANLARAHLRLEATEQQLAASEQKRSELGRAVMNFAADADRFGYAPVPSTDRLRELAKALSPLPQSDRADSSGDPDDVRGGWDDARVGRGYLCPATGFNELCKRRCAGSCLDQQDLAAPAPSKSVQKRLGQRESAACRECGGDGELMGWDGLYDCPKCDGSGTAARPDAGTRCWQCQKLWDTECVCPLPDPMCDPDGYAETIKRDRRRGAAKCIACGGQVDPMSNPSVCDLCREKNEERAG